MLILIIIFLVDEIFCTGRVKRGQIKLFMELGPDFIATKAKNSFVKDKQIVTAEVVFWGVI